MKINIKSFTNLGIAALFAFSTQIGFAAKPMKSESCECDGKLTTLTLLYQGDVETSIVVIQHNGEVIHEDLNLTPGEVFALTGTDQRGKKISNTTLGPMIELFLGDGSVQSIHTSCSVEITAGDVIGDFLVLTGTSRHNGLICGFVEPPCDPQNMECPLP